MKAQHTPGPWKNDDGTIRSSCGVSIAAVLNIAWPLGRKPENPEANARLIAAAPELLEALEGLLEEVEGCMCTYEMVARAAISKATGGEV